MSKFYPDAFYVLGLVLASIVFGWSWALRTYRRMFHEREIQLEERRKFILEKAEEEGRRFIEGEKKRFDAMYQEKFKEISEKERLLITQLEGVSGLSVEVAKEALSKLLFTEAREVSAKQLIKIESEFRSEADTLGKRIITTALQRLTTRSSATHHISVVHLENDEMKGRIIGREGRNIRHFEKISGVELIIDETPHLVLVSSYQPQRRAIATTALQQLVSGGQINLHTIEEALEKAEVKVGEKAKEAAQEVVTRLGVSNLHPELLLLLGRSSFYETGTENLLDHLFEVAQIAGIMAAELGLDQELAVRAGLLHDIGKIADGEIGGNHAQLGAQLISRFGEEERVSVAVASHHGEAKDFVSLIIQAANALAHQRPGVNREGIEQHINRLRDLEELACSLPGVSQAFALQAGRELRVLVSSEKVSDEMLPVLAREIAQIIEKNQSYPGSIKVSCVRETSATEYAS